MGMVWILPLGLAVGLVLGALGGGGAILTVPILVYLVGQEPSAATAGSLIVVGLTALAGVVSHHPAGNVRFRDGLIFGAIGTLGSLAGSRLSVGLPPHVLMTAFGVLMLSVAVLMVHQWRTGHLASGRGRRRGLPVLLVTASGVGFLTGVFGVGGGFAVVPALVLALGYAMPVAVGTSLIVIVVNSATALGARVVGGVDIDWPLILLFSVFGALGSLLGARVAARVDSRHLSLAFTILLVAVAAYVLAMNVPTLVS